MDRLLFITSLLIVHASTRELFGLVDGSKCENSDTSGICTLINHCPIAWDAVLDQGWHDFKRCGFEGKTEIVCCPTTSTRHVNVTDNKPVIRKAQKFCESYSKAAPIVLTYHIVGGENAEKGEFPHMAALGFYSVQDKVYRFDCGGTLISERYILTAAHCIVNLEQNKVKIARMGVVNVPNSVDEPDPELDYEVENFTVHRQYNLKEKFNDIALVKLAKDVIFNDNIRPACLYTKNDDPERLIVTGWGALALGGDKSPVLQRAKLRPVSLQNCNETYMTRIKRNIIKSQICAADERSDACQGDSGGPLQIQTNSSLASVVGITSYGIGCGSKYPGVYTRIQSYLDWIENIVWS